jgi:protein-disulfide isomerase
MTTPDPSRRPARRLALAAVALVLVVALARVPGTAAEDPVPDINTANAPTLGPADATLTIIEFADFECPHCARSSQTLHTLMKMRPGQVRWIFKSFPLGIATGGVYIHEAALAAHEQGKFWEMHDLLFASIGHVGRRDIPKFAQQLDLDMDAFMAVMTSRKYRDRVIREIGEGKEAGVPGTPTYFVNGQRLVGVRDLREWLNMLRRPAVPTPPALLPGPAVQN